jgi:hypothetical protein
MGLILNVQGQTSEGPFEFVASVGDVTVERLKQGLPSAVPTTQAAVVGQTVTIVSQSGNDGAAGPAGAPGQSVAVIEPDLDGLYATDAGGEQLFKQVIEDFSGITAATLAVSFSAYARAMGGAAATFRLRIGGTDGAVDGALVATLTASSASFNMLTTSASVANPGGRTIVKLTGQTSTVGLDAQIKSTIAPFVAG